jgi:hypothetical protein
MFWQRDTTVLQPAKPTVLIHLALVQVFHLDKVWTNVKLFMVNRMHFSSAVTFTRLIQLMSLLLRASRVRNSF